MKWFFWRRNAELREELDAHLLLAEREALESGHSHGEARRLARREFGNAAVAEEITRDNWGWRWLADMFLDARYGLRALRKNPGFAAVAMLTLAPGCGATTVMFAVLSGVLLKSLPLRRAVSPCFRAWPVR